MDFKANLFVQKIFTRSLKDKFKFKFKSKLNYNYKFNYKFRRGPRNPDKSGQARSGDHFGYLGFS